MLAAIAATLLFVNCICKSRYAAFFILHTTLVRF